MTGKTEGKKTGGTREIGQVIEIPRTSKTGKLPSRRVPNKDLRTREYPDSPYVFSTERKGPLTDSAARKIVARAGRLTGIGFPVHPHPHMLRHATEYYLASKGHDTRAIQVYMGHKNIQHTVRYTKMAPGRFKDFWRD